MFTREEYLRLPEGFRAELLAGILVKEPAPTLWHQILVGRLHLQLAPLVGPLRVVLSPVDVFVDDHNVLQPDLMVLPASARIRPGDREAPLPLLVVEVLSPSTADRDRREKVGIYLRAGVSEVWLVDPDAATGEIHTPAGVRSFTRTEPMRSAAVSEFVLDLKALLEAE